MAPLPLRGRGTGELDLRPSATARHRQGCHTEREARDCLGRRRLITAAKGWSECQDKASCKVSLEPKPGVGHGGGTGLEFVAKGKLWMGFGWNWFGWSPADAGTDISKHDKVRFWMKVTTEPGKVKPAPESVTVGLGGSSSNGKDATDKIRVDDYVQGFLDGEWHEIVIPIESLRHGKWSAFNPTRRGSSTSVLGAVTSASTRSTWTTSGSSDSDRQRYRARHSAPPASDDPASGKTQ